MGANIIPPPDTKGYYRPKLDWGTMWPSSSRNEPIAIAEMAPAHALNAWRRLQEVFVDEWEDVKRSPLPMSLLDQALGTRVHFDTDQAEQSPAVVRSEDELVEACYNALMDIAARELRGEVHIIRRSKIMADYIARDLGITLTKETS